MTQIVLHHYPQSPVTEKVRIALGVKSLDWSSVTIPRIPPKPDLIPLTGGYRRTPVMQIGADIYCDSQCIVDELQQRFPEPTLFPNNSEGLAWGLSRWIDGPMFTQAAALVLSSVDNLPADFAADRGRLYFGPDVNWDELRSQAQYYIAQLRGQFSWWERQLADGREFFMGDDPGLCDISAYYLTWFIRGRWAQGPDFLSDFPRLVEWENRIRAIGHGRPQNIASSAALTIANEGHPTTTAKIENAAGFELGMMVDIVPEGEGGDPAVRGELVVLTANRVAVSRKDEQVGEVVVHFPMVGYRVTPVVKDT